MYNVLIVDDEAPARALLKLKVDWTSINCSIVGEAKNGQEALDLYHALKPDLIITDIQMPVMNGIELIKAIRQVSKSQPIIILSCHESFSYARKAIQLGVQDYLIKDSFETDELYSIITDMFDARMNKRQVIAATVQSNTDHQKSLMTKSLMTSSYDQATIDQVISTHDLDLKGHQFSLLYIDIEILGQDPANPIQAYSLTDIELIQNLIRLSMKDLAQGEVCYDRGNVFIVICTIPDCHSDLMCRRETIALANHIRHSLAEHYPVQTTVGISNTLSHLTQLNKAYEESQLAANRKIINGYDKTYLSTVTTTIEDDHYIKILNVKLARINKALEEATFGPIEKELHDIFLQNLKGFMQYNYLKHTNWTLLGMLIDYCSHNALSYTDIFGSRSPWEDIMDIKTVDGMYTWFKKAIHHIEAGLKVEENTAYSYHVSKSIQYIKDHYSDAISLKALSDELDINNAYLSRLFKKETGIGLTDYINQVRIDKAKELIETTHKKMYEIAELTGFNNNQRFFSVFKKVVGESPGDYKKG